MAMELDLWIPDYNLGLEYQGRRVTRRHSALGQHHYHELTNAFGENRDLFIDRDAQKHATCFAYGVPRAHCY